MKLTNHEGLRAGSMIGLLLIELCLMGMWMGSMVQAQSFSTTTVQGTVYLANGQPGTGTLLVSWPSFTTASGQVVAADSMTMAIAPDGFVSVSLAPNLGATPAGLYYTAIFYLSDGTVNTQYWVVPAATSATLGQVQAQLMPSTQAVQTVSKSYVDQALESLAGGVLTITGTTMTGPLTLCCDPTTPLQAADKHYVDAAVALAVPLTGGTLTGPLTSVKLGALYQVDQFAGADFGAKLGACLSGLSTTNGGTCDARNFSGTLAMGTNLTISTANATVLLPCATISTANQVIVTAGTRNVSLRGCSLRGASTASGSQGGTVFYYSGTGAMVQVGDPTYAADTQGFHLDNVVINITAATSASAQGLAAYRTQELDLESLYFLGNSNQTGMTLDGTGNYTGGTFYDNEFSGFQTAVNGIGHQVTNPATTDWLNASTFVRLHIDCPTSGGNPVSGTYGINLQQGDGNTFTGGDVEGCSTALHLGANAQNNTIVGLRNENSTNQVVADAGSSYNLWLTGGTMFTGKLTDNGTHNSFTDSFHRAWNNLNGDLWRSQADATVINRIYTGIGLGNVRGRQDEWQTDVPGVPGSYQNAWQWGPGDGTSGAQVWALQDMLNNVPRFGVIQYTTAGGNNQSFLNGAGTGSVCVQCSTGAGSGGFVIGSGGATITTVASVDHQGDAQFQGTLQTAGNATFGGTTKVYNQADGEIDSILQAGLTAEQKESFIYRDHTGASQWYMVKDQYNNWALNSATGGLDSFKAYQSGNSGDTYINTSNSTGVVRINYETGSGTQFKVYGGNSSTVYAAFTGTTAIQFPGLAASSGHNCLQVDNSGYVTNTGSACGSGGGGGNGTVNSGTSGQIAYYNGTGTTLSGTSTVSVTSGGTGSATASGALTNLGGAALTGASFTGPVSTSGTLSAANNASIGPRYDVTNSAFGAKGDGSTDDTAAIQAAFNACYNGGVVPYGGVVEFPGRHTYNVSATINAYDSCRIEGVTGSVSTPGAPPRLAWNGAAAGAVSTITAFSITSNVVTFTSANSLTAGQYVDIEGLTAGSYLNRSIMQVSSTGLSSSQFTATLPSGESNVTTTSDSGTATTVNVLLAFDSNARYQQSITNMELLPASTAASGSLQVDVYYGSRVDTGTQILNTWAEGATMYGYYFANGGINAYFDQGWRCDGVGISCIYWRVSSSDSLGISNGTVDNSSSGANSGGAVMLDAAACGNQTGIHFTSKNMKIEINNSLTPGLGVFTMYDCPSNSNMEAFWLDLENNWVSPGSIGTAGFNFPSFVMSPANDAALSLTIVNGGFPEGVSPNTTTRWVGLPALLRSDMYNISSTIPFLSYAPSINSSGLYRAYNAPMSMIGDVNLSQIWHYGVQASDLLYSDTAFAALPNATTLYTGQILAPPAYWNGASGKRYALDVVYQTGTTGTPNSGNTTCTGSSGAYVLTCNSATDLSAGQRITIGTDTNKIINYVDATKPSAVLVNLGSSLGSTYSTATALSYSAPVLGPEIQMPTKSSVSPTSLAWTQGDVEQNSSAAANGVAAWVNVTSGTPGTWAGIPLGNSSGILSASQVAGVAGLSGATFTGTVTVPQFNATSACVTNSVIDAVGCYGADPTGTNDSTLAINSAIMHAYVATSSGATVRLAPGNYKVKTVNLTPSADLTVTAVSATSSSTAVYTVTMTSGRIPTTSGLLNISGTSLQSGAFNATNMAITAVSISPSTFTGTITATNPNSLTVVGTTSQSGTGLAQGVSVFPGQGLGFVSLVGAGSGQTTFVATTAGVPVVDMTGANDEAASGLTISSPSVVAEAGLLLSRITTAPNANGNQLTDIGFAGNYSTCGILAIAAEQLTGTRLAGYNSNSTNNYCDFGTAPTSDHWSATSSYGTLLTRALCNTGGQIYTGACTNTANQLIAPQFSASYSATGASDIVQFVDQADYIIDGGALIFGSGTYTGSCAAQYFTSSGGGNVFSGPVSWIGTHFESGYGTVHCLEGANAGYSYFNSIIQNGGYVVGSTTSSSDSSVYLLGGNTSPTYKNVISNLSLTNMQFPPSSTNIPIVEANAANDSQINLCTTGQQVDGMVQFASAQNSQVCAPTTSILTVNSTFGYSSSTPILYSTGTAAPTGGVFPTGYTILNTATYISPVLEWVVTYPGYLASGAWAASTSYSAGTYVTNAGGLYKAITGGTSGTTAPIWTSGVKSDGSLLWMYVASTSIGTATVETIDNPSQYYTPSTGVLNGGSVTVSGSGYWENSQYIYSNYYDVKNFNPALGQVVNTGYSMYSSYSPGGGTLSWYLSNASTSAGGSPTLLNPFSLNYNTATLGSGVSLGNVNGTLLPSTLTGFHGSGAGDVKVQLSDGTGTSTHLATFDANGGLTDGGGIPASANALSSNSNSQPVASTSHNLSVPANCAAASGSGTAYTCITSPTFTPATGDHIQFKADVANTGSATLAVNGATAATIKKWGGSGNLIANDLLAGHWISATFDGTYWQLEGQLGNANATQINGTAISGMSGSGSMLALTTSPTFTGNSTTFANNSASTDYVVIQPGTTSTAYLGGIQLNSAAATPVTEWYIEEDTSYDLKIHDQGATTPMDILTAYINGSTNINSQGSSAVTINNSSTGAGTGGFIVYEGGANYNIAALTVTSSGNVSAPGTLTAGGVITGGMGVSLSSATSIAATSFTSTGLALPAIPVSTTKRGMCVLIWEQNTAVGTVQFGMGMNNAPTNLWVINQDSPGTYKAPTYTTIASTTTTAVSATDAPSATATGYRDEIEFTLTTGSSSAVTVTVYGLSSSTSDALVIEPGSYCTWLP